ncbi:hypothetical protein VP01_2210g2 [Puccinia sorghi]|uniref:Uncharacterized protein n=1 Tax=Puccinia sorghi TaxID=27349 RepID=A0A0L6V8W7_9BASI|nr:hypothetical protein VP01_2210g2 [Puccinia sorghi]
MNNMKSETKPKQTSNTSGTNNPTTMDKIELIYLKAVIDSIPILMQDNYTLWHNGKGTISTGDEWNFRTIIKSRLDAKFHANVITHENKDDVVKMWKAINDYFASEHSANSARVWNHFFYLAFNQFNVNGFITQIKSAITKLHKVRLNKDVNIIGYKIIKKLPKNAEYNRISTDITHSDFALTHKQLSRPPRPPHSNKSHYSLIPQGNSVPISIILWLHTLLLDAEWFIPTCALLNNHKKLNPKKVSATFCHLKPTPYLISYLTLVLLLTLTSDINLFNQLSLKEE